MARLKVITDSTCDLPSRCFKDNQIGIVPINIQFGASTFEEGITIDPPTFYKKVDELGMLPKTSQPSVGQFAEAYRAAAAAGYDSVLSLHVTGKLSGTVNSAALAAQEVAQEIKVIPFDSMAGSAALGYMCVEAVQMARAGKSVDEILARLKAVRPHVRISLSLATLRYAQMSGRISNLQSILASLLNVQPIISLQNGLLLPNGRVRSRAAALDRLVEMAKQAAADRPVKFAVIHGQVPVEAEELMARAKESLHCVEAFVKEIAISLAVHFGPGVIGTVLYPAEFNPIQNE